MATLKSRAAQALVSPRLADWRRRAVDAAARLRGHAPELTLYYQPGDAYSHLCAQLLRRIRARLTCDLRIVVLPDLDHDDNTAPGMARAWAVADATRIAPAWGLDLSAESRAPDAETRRAAARILLAAESPADFLAREADIAPALWRNNAADLSSWPAVTDGDADSDADAKLAANASELHARGHYQGGMWYLRGDWYWGLDRLDYLQARLRGLDCIDGDAPLATLTPGDAYLPPLAMPDTLTMFYSFRSPYSYIALERASELARTYGLALQPRPVLPMVLRGFRVPRAKRLYIVRDARREADRHGVAFGRIADPIDGGVQRCLAAYVHAEAAGRATDFMRAAGRAIWARGEAIKRDAVLRRVLQRAGLNPALAAECPASGGDLGWAEANREALFDLGLWGVPSFQVGDLAVWGQDRLWLVDEALRRASA